MASVVFLRGVNVGGSKVFKPSELVKKLDALDIVNIGAAGTFVIRRRMSQAELRRCIADELPFDADIIIRSDKEVTALMKADPFAKRKNAGDIKQYVSVLSAVKRSGTKPALPIVAPSAGAWQVRVFDVRGGFVLSEHRRGTERLIYPNEVVEKQLGPATTRNWNTFERIAAVLMKQR